MALRISPRNAAEAVIFRLLDHTRANKAQLSRLLGVQPQTINSWIVRNSPNWDLIFQKFPDIDLNWLVRGDKPDSHTTHEFELLTYQIDRGDRLAVDKDRLQVQVDRLEKMLSESESERKSLAAQLAYLHEEKDRVQTVKEQILERWKIEGDRWAADKDRLQAELDSLKGKVDGMDRGMIAEMIRNTREAKVYMRKLAHRIGENLGEDECRRCG